MTGDAGGPATGRDLTFGVNVGWMHDGEPARSAAAAAGSEGLMTVQDYLDSPLVLYARTPQDAAAELLRRSARWGIRSWCTHPASGPALAAVIKELRS